MKLGKFLLNLIRLSKVDSKIFLLNTKIEEYTVLLKQCRSQKETMERESAEDQEKLRKLALRLKKQDADILEFDNMIKKNYTQLSEIKKNDEYKAMLTKIEDKKTEKSSQEELYLESLEEEELLKKTMNETSEKRKSLLLDIEQRKKNIEKNLAETKESIKEQDSVKAGLFKDLPPDIKEIYFKILNRRKDGALSLVQNDEYCGACAMFLTAETVEDCKKGDELLCCPTCSRILYHSDFLARISTSGLDDVI